MEENILPEVINFKLYKRNMLTASTFLAGPLVGGYLIAENFNHLGEKGKAGKTWMITILTLILILGSFFIPAIDKVPGIIFPIIYTSIATYFIQKHQATQIKFHEENGGEFYSGWRVALASLISIIILFILVFGMLLLTNQVNLN